MRGFVLMFAFLMAWPCLQAKAETLVVAVSGTQAYSPGERLDPGQSHLLPAGARVTLLSQSGAIQVVEGPVDMATLLGKATNPTGSEEGKHWEQVTAFFSQPDIRSDVLGASRSMDGEVPEAPGIWHISTDSSGPRCVKSNELMFWRRDPKIDQTLSARSAEINIKELKWTAGDETLSLPKPFTLTDGRMIVSVDGALRELELHVFPLNGDPNERMSLLRWLIAKKCDRQVWSLIRKIHWSRSAN